MSPSEGPGQIRLDLKEGQEQQCSLLARNKQAAVVGEGSLLARAWGPLFAIFKRGRANLEPRRENCTSVLPPQENRLV